MAWKNIQQRSLADAMLINHDVLEELDPVHDLIDWSKVEKHLAHIHAKKLGEKAWRLLLCSRLYCCRLGTI